MRREVLAWGGEKAGAERTTSILQAALAGLHWPGITIQGL